MNEKEKRTPAEEARAVVEEWEAFYDVHRRRCDDTAIVSLIERLMPVFERAQRGEDSLVQRNAYLVDEVNALRDRAERAEAALRAEKEITDGVYASAREASERCAAALDERDEARRERDERVLQCCGEFKTAQQNEINDLRTDLARLRAELEAADDCIASHEGLRTAIVTLTAERDKWKAYAEDREKMDDALSEGQFELRDQLAALRVREGQLREAIKWIRDEADQKIRTERGPISEPLYRIYRKAHTAACSSPPDAPDVLGTIRRLAKEVSGAMGAFEHEMREAIGNTNYACITDALATLRAAGVIE